MAPPRRRREQLDGPWKEALEHFLESFLDLCFPQVHAGIDWSRGYQSLDKELHENRPRGSRGKRLADKLFKVWREDGKDAWLLVHVEVQGRREPTFAERMYRYNYRIHDRYDRQAASLAVLCDDDPGRRPDHFGYNNWGCEVGIRFPVVKIIDHRGDEATLEQSANPFAAVVLAQLKVLETRHAPATRWQWKLRLVKGLYDRGLDRGQIRQLIRLMDWMLALPPELEHSFRAEVHSFEEARRMPYVTSFERLAREESRQEGVAKVYQDAILELLELNFKKVGTKQARKVRAVCDIKRLQALLRGAREADTLDEALSAIQEG
jgi:hypothetical protein